MPQYANLTYNLSKDGVEPAYPVDPERIEQLARKAMKRRGLEGERAIAYIAANASSGATARANRQALDRLRLRPRVLPGYKTPDLGVKLLGTTMPAPIILAPIGVQRLISPEAGEIGSAQAAANLGLTFVHSTASSTAMEEVAASVNDAPRWYQLYIPRDRELAKSFIRRAEASGYTALLITLDTTTRAWRPDDLNLGHLPFLRGIGIQNYLADPVFRSYFGVAPTGEFPGDRLDEAVTKWREVAADPTINWETIAWLRKQTALPIALKGILDPDDARQAADHGLQGVVVSNHGGRQLDGAIASIDALPPIAEAVGDQLTVLFDSGVRSGADALKAHAMGAKGILLGRPWAWALGLGGQAAVEHYLRAFLADYEIQLGNMNLIRPDRLNRSHLATS